MNKTSRLLCIYLIGAPLWHATHTIDNPHFYRANFFWGEPRLERPWLGSFEINGATGTTTQSRNGAGHKTSLLNIYGPQALQHLAAGLTDLDPNNPLDKILLDLNNLPDNGTFGQLRFGGSFRTTEAFINLHQNLDLGFFLQIYLPVRNLTTRGTQRYTDLSPHSGGSQPNDGTPVWRAFLQNVEAILRQHGRILPSEQTVTDFGDLSILAGWTYNYQDTCVFDYIDVTTKIGFLAPTGRKQNPAVLFSLPTGYNGFKAVPVKFLGSFGALDWLTVGCNMGALFFFDRWQHLFVTTDPRQNGFITLGRLWAEVQQGTIWDLATYAKADHVVHGLSFLFGYTYTKQDKTIICPHKAENFIMTKILAEEQYKSWRMHVLHFMAEYDFTERDAFAGSKVGFFYNMVVGGSRIYNTNIKDGYVGLDVIFCF